MFDSLERLKNGTGRQREAYAAIEELGVFAALSAYEPLLCGTLPIGIDVAGSDLDIIMRVEDFAEFTGRVEKLYGTLPGFRVKDKEIRNVPTVKANFAYGGFPIELFGQPQAVVEQYAYLHMVVEEYLLRQQPEIKAEVIRLKDQGVKTEPAFAQVLSLAGDPYEALLVLGRKLAVI
ncbi:DUF4269 domain-containing protein [Gorillibacterium massiliense]|uniref:DUF4269 domain-containing protein n=1 Tax=Gorillibacterium massiliense TaxID=1280390 RepID=UPI0004B6D96A|nr:DUF4269 domain-containing protein [Gorillibacterium massiliense]